MRTRAEAVLVVALFAAVWGAASAPAAPQPGQLASAILDAAGVRAGLCVHLGCGDGKLTAALAEGTRFLVHGLDADAGQVAKAQRHLRSRGIYGQAWAEQWAGPALPYAENLVNLVVAADLSARDAVLAEVSRVVCPGGVALFGRAGADEAALAAFRTQLAAAGFADFALLGRGGAWLRARKPWPADIDEWGHPRHGPDGNAASRDRQAGPPRRLRWIAGPMHEASNLVTAGGRFFYAGLIARDAFNGLRLWERPITPTPMRLGYPASAVKGSMLPVAAGDRLYVVTDGKLQAFDAATGRTVCVYDAAGTPSQILSLGEALVTTDGTSVRGLDADGGKLRWTYEAAEPSATVAAGGAVFLLEGRARRGEKRAIVRIDLATGKPAWKQADYPWAAGIRRLSCGEGLLVCEVSTFNNDRPGNRIVVLSETDGAIVWQRPYEPGMSHYMQARAIRTAGLVWVLNGGAWEGLDPRTGSILKSHPAGTGHCYPPVATPNYLVSGEMNFTDANTGRMDANRISKGACGRDAGFVPANGLVYCAPKHCTCYPMVRGYVAMAPAKAGPAPGTPVAEALVAERGPAADDGPRLAAGAAPGADEWPCYRADPWRSGSSAAAVPADVDIQWTATLDARPADGLPADWRENPFVRGPVTPPVVAGGLVVVAEPDGHRVAAFDARTGQPRWNVTAVGRIDTPPTLWRGLCLFGTRSGYIYCLRASDGALVWRLRAGPCDQRIVSFGQVESPWPVPGSLLPLGDTVYATAGRHPLADGGVRVFALDPASGKVRWVRVIDRLPMTGYYGGAGLEFDCIDLLAAEAVRPTADAAAPPSGDWPDYITMSRWQMDPKTGATQVVAKSGFGYYGTGAAGVVAPRGLWTYGPRNSYLPSGPQPGKPDYVRIVPRPLMVFRGGTLVASTDEKRGLFRKDFTAETAAAFNDEWYNQRHVPRGDKKGDRNRAERLAHGATWSAGLFDQGPGVGALVLAGETVFAAGQQGRLVALAASDGAKRAERDLPAPVWDGMAAAYGRLYVSTRDGRLLCLGKE